LRLPGSILSPGTGRTPLAHVLVNGLSARMSSSTHFDFQIGWDIDGVRDGSREAFTGAPVFPPSDESREPCGRARLGRWRPLPA
jgi:hypothetical protein